MDLIYTFALHVHVHLVIQLEIIKCLQWEQNSYCVTLLFEQAAQATDVHVITGVQY